ncbi:MAG: ATP-binding protein, partial [Lachnospiraceae bacterium]|nr:ATP-binding protein [Lachnospiraceae bacterium]
MILGRTSERNYLNTYYDRDKSQIMVGYGERNVGKTFLLRQFVKDKPCFYYRARSASEREQRYQWSSELWKEGIKIAKYPSFTEIFSAIRQGQNGKTVIIIDEFQYIVKSGSTFMKELADFAYSAPQDTSVMFLLCSSSIGWVENDMVTRIGEAAHGLSGFLKVKELDFELMREYFPAFSMEQSIEVFAVLGGVPGFWKCFDDRMSVKENICKCILNQDAFLYGEGQRIGKEELLETSVYNT